MNLVVTLFIKKMNKLIVTIFGATGDLTLRKLLPALENIIKSQKDFSSMSIVAVGRRPYTSEEYLTFVSESKAFSGDIAALRPHLIYAEVDAVNPSSYEQLKTLYVGLTRNYDQVRHIFYLAVGPDLFIPITESLVLNGILHHGHLNEIIAFEKPFGHTYEDACAINDYLEKLVTKEQLYRVDHYLGKEMIQNILGLRFANQIFHALWNKNYMSEVKIFVSEKDGILNRGAYYDEVGVLNDMVQSHLLQVLALLTMDEPKSLNSLDLQQAKIEALHRIHYVSEASLLGQYKGYRNEKGVDPNSMISTLAFLTFHVDHPQFKEVPFYLLTGKQLDRKEAYIEIVFKEPASVHLFSGANPNRLRIEIAPQARVTLSINSREDMGNSSLENIGLDHCYNCVFPSAIKEAYEFLFVEMMYGRMAHFPSWEEIKASWEIVNQVRANKPRWIIYEPGFSLDGGSQNGTL